MSDDYSCVGWDRISEACSSFVNETNDECCICLEHYSNLNSFPCHVSHKICKNCLDNCYQRKNKKCPMCRSNVPNDFYCKILKIKEIEEIKEPIQRRYIIEDPYRSGYMHLLNTPHLAF